MQLKTDMQKTVKDVSLFLKANSLDQKTIKRFALFLEEALLVYRDDPSFDTFTVKCEKHIKTVTIKIVVPGKSLNPMENDLIIERAMKGMETPPVWSYRNGRNIIVYKPILLFSSLNSLKFVWSHMRGERKKLFATLALNLLEIAAELALPIFSAMVIAALTTSAIKRLVYMTIVVLLLRLIRDVLTYKCEIRYSQVYKSMLDSLSAGLTRKMLEIKVDSIRKNGSGLFIQRLTSDVNGLTDRFDAFLQMATQMIQYFGILIGFAIISFPLFLYQLVTAAILIWIETHRADVYQQNERKARLSAEAYTDAVGEIVRANREIKLYQGKKAFLEIVSKCNGDLTRLNLHKQITNNKYCLLRWDLREAFHFIFVMILVLYVIQGRMDVAIAVVLYNYNESMFGLVGDYGWFMSSMKMTLLYCERLYQLMSGRDFPVEHFGDTHIDRMRGEISFENVTFAYPSEKEGKVNRTILDHMDLQIKPGEYVAITGRSGCGKTTMFNLITKLFEAQRGAVKLDGVNIRRLDEASIRSNIAIVTQNPYIMHMTIRENLRIAKADATEEEMIAACKQACIHEDILRMENGYDTHITDDGASMSGGQRQRLAIAMCILKDAPILLMDEATSALDNITQCAVQDNIKHLSDNRTVLVIAHRMSTIVNCDRILFMNEGRIAASGTHEQLMKTCEEYRKLYESDQKRDSDIEE